MVRKPKVVVISDTHLGSIGCYAKELSAYLHSIHPEILILNGDIIDFWNFNKYYWNRWHTPIVRRLIQMMEAGTKVYYLTGNHDGLLRRYGALQLGSFYLLDQLVLELEGKKYGFFHGDLFDKTTTLTPGLARLGGLAYNVLVLANRLCNSLLKKAGRQRLYFSRKVKNSIKWVAQFISDFEEAVAEQALADGYDYIVCGHIHQPVIRTLTYQNREIVYMNPGDWIENLTALEFENGQWQIYAHAAFCSPPIPVPSGPVLPYGNHWALRGN